MAQIPVRFVFLAKMRRAEIEGHSIEACVTSYTASPAWRSSKKVSIFTYGWFVLGIVWVVNSGDCVACQGIYRMTVSVIIQAIARAVVALMCFRAFFPLSEHENAGTYKVEGASLDRIYALPALRFSRSILPEQGCGCAICLSDYEENEF